MEREKKEIQNKLKTEKENELRAKEQELKDPLIFKSEESKIQAKFKLCVK